MISKSAILMKTAALLTAGFCLYIAVMTAPQLIDTFRRTDPTGAFGFNFYIMGFCANAGTVFLSSLVLLGRDKVAGVPAWIIPAVFILKGVEALTFAPCLIDVKGDNSLCGVYWAMFSNLAILPVFGLFILFVLRSGKVARGPVFKAGMTLFCALALAGLLSYLTLTPKTAAACLAYDETTDRAACLKGFAEKTNDPALCRQIDFRSTRFACLYEMAEATGNPALCAEIEDSAGTALAPYESPSVETRDLCHYLLGFKLRDPAQCARVVDEEKREICENGVRERR